MTDCQTHGHRWEYHATVRYSVGWSTRTVVWEWREICRGCGERR